MDEGRESFTMLLMANGHRGEPAGALLALPWSGVIVAADGDVLFTSGAVESKERAWALMRDWLSGWRLRDYERIA